MKTTPYHYLQSAPFKSEESSLPSFKADALAALDKMIA
jgi:hypothetical protein